MDCASHNRDRLARAVATSLRPPSKRAISSRRASRTSCTRFQAAWTCPPSGRRFEPRRTSLLSIHRPAFDLVRAVRPAASAVRHQLPRVVAVPSAPTTTITSTRAINDRSAACRSLVGWHTGIAVAHLRVRDARRATPPPERATVVGRLGRLRDDTETLCRDGTWAMSVSRTRSPPRSGKSPVNPRTSTWSARPDDHRKISRRHQRGELPVRTFAPAGRWCP